jgi:hypothetical protein
MSTKGRRAAVGSTSQAGNRPIRRQGLLQAWGDAEAWEHEKARLWERPGTVTPVRVIGSTVILERVPVVVRVVRSGGRIEGIVIELTPGKPPEPEEVADAYRRTLESAGVSRYHERAVSIDYAFNDYRLRIGVRPKQVHMGFGYEGAFPAPDIFREEYERRMAGTFGSRSGRTRAAGGPMAPDNSIPAIVAFYLRIFGQVSWKQVYSIRTVSESSRSVPRGFSIPGIRLIYAESVEPTSGLEPLACSLRVC